MKINEITEKYLISRRMIQEYTDIGLIEASSKNKYGHLIYDEATVKKMITIRYFQELGMSLSDIRKLYDSSFNDRTAFLKQYMKHLDQRLARLNTFAIILEDIAGLDKDDNFADSVYSLVYKKLRKNKEGT